jgi:hypothetical protein
MNPTKGIKDGITHTLESAQMFETIALRPLGCWS